MERSGKIIVYDIKSHPKQITMLNIEFILKTYGFLLWDSDLGGSEPTIIELEPNEDVDKERYPFGIKIVNINPKK